MFFDGVRKWTIFAVVAEAEGIASPAATATSRRRSLIAPTLNPFGPFAKGGEADRLAGRLACAQPGRSLLGRLGHPVAGQEEPEGEAGLASVKAEPAEDCGVGHLLLADESRVLRPRPGVEDEVRVAADQHHHGRGCV